MRADLRALLQRLAKGEQRFDNPTEDLVDDLRTLEAYGWASSVIAKRSATQPGHPYYIATGIITEEGRLALQDDEDTEGA
jgi:hypothetical protein